MKILNATQIKQKTKRLAIEIAERHYGEQTLLLAGINRNGFRFAELILTELRDIMPDTAISLSRVSVATAAPLSVPVGIDIDKASLENQIIILIDDVANTGRTLFYALQPFMSVLPHRIEVAVLVDRSHKSFPVHTDYNGLLLSTTLQDYVIVALDDSDEGGVYLTTQPTQ